MMLASVIKDLCIFYHPMVACLHSLGRYAIILVIQCIFA